MTPAAKAAREAARKEGQTCFVGDPCYRGHSGRRYTSSSECFECSADRSLARQQGARCDIRDARRATGPGAPSPRKIIQRVLLIAPSRTCSFIIADDYHALAALGHLEKLYCGAKSVPGFSYCEEHRDLCYYKYSPIHRQLRPDVTYRLKRSVPNRLLGESGFGLPENIADLAVD